MLQTLLISCISVAIHAHAEGVSPAEVDLTVDGVQRQALIFSPKKFKKNPPVIFCFHGHGGNMRYAARTYDLQEAWPEAVVVYAQGLPTSGAIYDPKGRKNGWDVSASESNKDLRFFDALYTEVEAKTQFAPSKVFAMGHSNGGFFMYTLWAMRPQKLAAVGIFEAANLRIQPPSPKPAFVTIGQQDTVVPVQWQERGLNAIFRINQSDQGSTEFGPLGKLYKGSQPTVLWTYPGGHTFNREAVPFLVQFFKSLAQP